MRFSLAVPTLNAGELWKDFLQALSEQTLQPDEVLVIDSGSCDDTVSLAKKAGCNVHEIKRDEFNHGSTRQLAVEMLSSNDVIVFMTQDVLLNSPKSFAILMDSFKKDGSKSIGAVCGRQLPHHNANLIAAHSRLYNYKNNSSIFTKNDISKLGMKATFMSDSFSAYRVEVLRNVGGFEKNIIVCEDALLAGKMLLAGYSTVYTADSTVRHSHNFKLMEEAQRYFDIGVAHSSQEWFIDTFGEPEGEGFRYMKSEFNYLVKKNPFVLPSAFVRNFLKYIFYRIGRREKYFPVKIKKILSYQKYFWENKNV
ncbi:MAG: glycosyltransferase [Gammaproteobacteria bacterium]|nr:glycosyltransferase [Gammaproteobacteria bacterium]